jgi:hypothetical protein
MEPREALRQLRVLLESPPYTPPEGLEGRVFWTWLESMRRITRVGLDEGKPKVNLEGLLGARKMH